MAKQEDAFKDPHWFPVSFDERWEKILFAKTTPAALRAAPFLDNRFHDHLTERIAIPVTSLLEQMDQYKERLPSKPMIFHSAFCCSTLVSKACDSEGVCLSLKEPHILMSLANAKRMIPRTNNAPDKFGAMFSLVTGLLARRFSSEEQILLKPTNLVNNIARDYLSSGSIAILMYSDLQSFLVSVLKKGESGKSFMRSQYNVFALDPVALANIPQRQAMTFTDLQVATLVWRHQMELFSTLLCEYPEKCRSLKDTDFLNHKEKSLSIINQHLELNIPATTISEIVAGPIFRRNVKFEETDYGTDQKQSEDKSAYEKYAEEIDGTLQWANSLRLDRDFVLPLANSLLGE